MKKKIILMLALMAMLICVLAISSSAVEKGGIYYAIESKGENTYAVVTNENRSKCTLETVTIPATIEVDGVTYKVTKIAENAFGQVNGDVNAYLKHLVIGANVSVVEQHAFRRVTTLQTVKIQNTEAASPITFYNAQFMDCSSLKSVEAKDAKIAQYGDYCFWNCSNLETVEFPPMLTRLGINCFRDCAKLTTGDLSNTQISEVGPWVFGSCKALTKIIFPSTLTTIGNNVFLYCPVETYVFPHNVNSIGADTLAHQSSIKVLIMPEIDETHNINAGFLYGTRPNVIIYSGNNVEFFKSQFSSMSGYDVQPFANYVPGTTYRTNTIFYGAGNTCPNCNGLFAKTDNPCVGDCTHCGALNVPKANPVHNIVTSITYASFDKEGTKTFDCINEGCAHAITQAAPALFTCPGYSTPEKGNDGIAISFTVNNEAIKEYEKITGKTLTYGVFAVAKVNLGTNDIFDKDGKASNGVINAEITGYEFASFDLRICGFEEEHKSALLAMGAYVIASDKEATDAPAEYSYLQASAPNAGEKYAFVSYNDIVGNPSTDEEVTK